MKEWLQMETAFMENLHLCQENRNIPSLANYVQQAKNNEHGDDNNIVDNFMAIVASDDVSIATNMVENKVVMSELEQNMLKEQEIKNTNKNDSGHVFSPTNLQSCRILDAGRVRRHRLNNRLWSLRRQSSDLESLPYSSSSVATSSTGISSGAMGCSSSIGSSSSVASKLLSNFGACSSSSSGIFGMSASAAALSSAMLTVSAPVSRTPDKLIGAASDNDTITATDNSNKTTLEIREIPVFRKNTAKTPKLRNQRSITTVIEEASSC